MLEGVNAIGQGYESAETPNDHQGKPGTIERHGGLVTLWQINIDPGFGGLASTKKSKNRGNFQGPTVNLPEGSCLVSG